MGRKYRVNADSWTVLADILTGTPESFNVTPKGTLWGTTAEPESYYLRGVRGWLSGDVWNEWRGHLAAGAIDYVVFSYHTPIAYRITTANPQTGEHTSKWIVPDVRYSNTTSKHQGKVRTALSQANVPVRTA